MTSRYAIPPDVIQWQDMGILGFAELDLDELTRDDERAARELDRRQGRGEA